MVSQYANTAFRKLSKNISKSDFTINLACKTASEFDKTSGIVGVDNIVSFVTLQIILRLTSFDDTSYCRDIENNKDSLICDTGIVFDSEFDITEYTFTDQVVTKAINMIAAEKMLKLQDIFDDNIVKDFVNPNYYEKFIKDRAKKDDFFTNRESAVLFGIPSSLIEGILVGRTYEKDQNVLNEIKRLLPNCYICNLDGKVIEN